MAVLSVSTLSKAGVLVTTQAVSGTTDKFANTGSEVVYVYNGATPSRTLTFAAQGTCSLGGSHSVTATVTSDGNFYGPFDPTHYNDSNNRVQITYSTTTSIQVAVFKML